jgi:ATP/maltotriose-dependent transcriptional regulator MalT
MTQSTLTSSAQVVERDRLLELIDPACPVTLLVAPAGCGKSTVLSQYLARCREPYVRFDVRREHAGLLGFVRGFAEAVQSFAPSARISVADAVTSALSMPSPGEFLAEWITRNLPAFSGTVVLDDIHLAMEDAGCCDFLDALVRLTSSRFRWVIAGRGAGRLPLSAWQEDGLVAFGPSEEDLRFTRAEVAVFGEAELRTTEIDALLSQTAGWAVALSLAMRLRRRSPDLISALASARELSHDFLADQIYASLTPEEQSILAVAAFLPEIDVAVLQEAGFHDAGARLDELYRRHSILTPLDNASAQATTYRCHDLFRDYIVAQVNQLSVTERNAVKLEAARALDVCGRIIPAFRLYAEAGDADTTLYLIERNGFELIDNGHSDALSVALQSLPAHYASHPAVLGAQGYIYFQQTRYDEASAWFNRALIVARDDYYRAKLAVFYSMAMFARIANPTAILEPLAENELLPIPLRAELLTLLAGSYVQFEPQRDIAELYDRALALTGQIPDPAVQTFILNNLGKIAEIRGLPHVARNLLLRAVHQAEAAGLHGTAADAYEALSLQAMREGEDAKAMDFAERSREAAEKSGRIEDLRGALHRHVSLLSISGRREELDRTLGRCKDVMRPEDIMFNLTSMSVAALSAAWDADYEKAYAIQTTMGETLPKEIWDARMLAHARCALFLAALKRRDEALVFVKRALEEHDANAETAAQPRYARFVEFSAALCAFSSAIVADKETARRLLARTKKPRTASGAAMLAAVSAIVDAPDMHGGAVTAAFARLDEVMLGGYTRLFERILSTLRGEAEARHGLTQSELEILRALAAGDSPKTIALERGSSIFTVRRHIRGFVDKLGCRGYRQALKVARELGIA